MSQTGCGGPLIAGDHSLKNLLKKIGKGPKLSKDLMREESRDAFAQILSQAADPAQTGAFLIALRMKGETADELAGCVAALREKSSLLEQHGLPLLLELAPAHDGKTKSLVLTPFIAMTLAKAGVPTLVTGASDVPTKKGITPRAVFAAMGIPVDDDAAAVSIRLKTKGFAYYDTARFCPALESLKPLRDALGLRTPLNVAEKLIRPSLATHLCTGVFHGPYLKEMAEAGIKLGVPNLLCLQAPEGGTDLPLKKRTLCRRSQNSLVLEQFEINPSTYMMKRDDEPLFKDPTAADTQLQIIQEGISTTSHPIRDALIYNVAVQLWFTEVSKTLESAIETARDLL